MKSSEIIIKVDEDLPKKSVQLLRDYGYNAASVLEQKMGGFADDDLWPIIQADKDFLSQQIRVLPIFGNIHPELTKEFYYFCLI